MINFDFDKCTACGACVQKCPKNCITLRPNQDGFLFPNVDIENCIECNLCNDVCTIAKRTSNAAFNSRAFAAQNNDPAELKRSTSGGAFGAIAAYVFSKHGVVYGCAYVDRLKATHIRIEKQAELALLNGSKYVQSNTMDTYIKAKEDLNNGTLVLYSGTPCQIAALKSYLGKEYENLITVDIICHGVPSQEYFDKFIDWYEKKNRIQISDYNFRSKDNHEWSLTGICIAKRLKDNKEIIKKLYYFDNYYYHYFMSGDIYRRSCYSCKYTTLNREGDFTLGDLWGAESFSLPFSIEQGCSLMLVNTPKAEAIFNELNILWCEIPIEEAVKHNGQLKEPTKFNETKRAELLRQYRECDAQEIQRIYISKQRKARLKGRIKYLIPNHVKYSIKRIIYKR